MEENKEKAKQELEKLLSDFRNNFNISSGGRNLRTREESNGFDIAMHNYKQPELNDEVSLKIQKLKKIAEQIEIKSRESHEHTPDLTGLRIKYQECLNETQFLAATTLNGPVLVIAGAGSGKTRTIIYRLAYLMEKGVSPEKILLLTFTRKASNEMIERSNELLEESKSGNVMGGTFHSFANYILRKYYKVLEIPPNFTIVDTGDAEDIIDLIRQELKFDKKEKAFPRKSRIQTIISKARNCNLTVTEVIDNEYKGLSDFISEIELIASVFAEYKKANNMFDYDDLMEFLRDSLRDNEVFRSRLQAAYPYIMVDEFQDTNVVQKEIIDFIAQKYRNIMVVGDDAQSIYAFRGANVENILRFPETYPECRVIKIEKNYRSNQDILNFTNAVINKAVIGYKKHLIAASTKSGKPFAKKFYSQEDEARFIVSKILELREKNIPLNQIAVLFRSSFHSNFIQAELLKRNIPYLVYGGLKFTERRHVKDIVGYLRIILNPLDAVSWNRILKLIPGVGSATASKIIKEVARNMGNIDIEAYKGKKFFEPLKDLKEVLDYAGKEEMPISHKIESLKRYYQPILKAMENDYKVRMLDIDVLNMLAAKYEKLERFLSDFALEPPSNQFQDKSTPMIDESEDKPLVLSTIHSAKGLEWNTVFVPHLLDGLLPSANSFNDIEDLEEERRLFYVACTRAKERLYLTMPSYVQSWDSFFTYPSRFIAETDKNKYVVV